jgi:ribonuclease PH
VPRPDDRRNDQLRPLVLERKANPYAEGSCLIRMGGTLVHCTASVETGVPGWKKGSGEGWVTAEYAMLPRATIERTARERNGPGGRTQEIQRLIGRSLRAAMGTMAFGEYTIRIDCDVLQADGGTRTAAITGGFVALGQCVAFMKKTGMITARLIKDHVAAISCGIYKGEAVLDLDYDEDSAAQTDANFVLTGTGGLVEVQGTAEGAPFSEEQLLALLKLARKGVGELVELQKQALL